MGWAQGWLETWGSWGFVVAVLAGSAGQLCGIGAIIAFIILGIVNETPFGMVKGPNWWLAIIWAAMLWKWAFGLFWYAR